MRSRLSYPVVLLLLLNACASLESSRLIQDPSYATLQAKLADVPFFPQQDYYCGPAALASVLNWSGVEISVEQLVPQVYLPERKGSLQVEVLSTARRYQRIPYVLAPKLEDLLREIKAGHPVLVLQNLGLEMLPAWHYAVVTGINMPAEEIILHSGDYRDYVMDLDTFERTWLRASSWALLVLPPERLPVTADAGRYVRSVHALEQLKDYEGATAAYLAASRRWPHDKNLMMALGNIYYKQSKLGEAAQAYRKLIAADPDFAPAHNNLAQTYYDLGRLEQAREHVNKAIALGGKHQQVYRQTLEMIQKDSR